MTRTLCSGNSAAAQMLALAGEANRLARGCVAGAYPITPQTEIIESLRAFPFTKGRVVAVESEHSAMGVCIGASLAGARAFTASSSNGLAYMTENVFAAGYFRLPVVMIAVNRTVGPPWNIWADQGDSLALRDAPWLQFYTESHQDLVDTTLLAFRVAEDRDVLLPVMVAMDGFITSHTMMSVDLPDLDQVGRFLPECRIPHKLSHESPATIGGLTWPRETERHRREIQEAMERVPRVLAMAIDEFEAIFGRRPAGALEVEDTDDAETIVIASSTMASAARSVVRHRRARGERIGLIRIKQFRPFPRTELMAATRAARRIGVLDRNHSPGSGGIFWNEVATTLQGRSDLVVQDYLVGIGGGDVTPKAIDEIVNDLNGRAVSSEPVWAEVSS